MATSSRSGPRAGLPAWAGAGLAFVLLAAAVRAEESWETAVERARRQQDREIASAQRRELAIDTVVRRYRQQVLNENSALNHYLLGRACHFAQQTEAAIESMLRARQMDPGFWYADWALAQLYAGQQRVPDARAHLEALLQRKPDHEDGRGALAQVRMLDRDFLGAYELLRGILAANPGNWEARRAVAQCLLELERWELARTQLRKLILEFPREVSLRRALVAAHLELEDWSTAVAELRQLERVTPEDPLVLWQLALASYRWGEGVGDGPEQAARLEESVAVLQRLAALKPGVLHVLDLLQTALGQLGRHEARVGVLEAMRPALADKPAEQERLDGLIAALRAALAGGVGPEGAEPTWQRDPLAELLERCVHPDEEIRRTALHEYLQGDLPFVDPVLYQRYHPDAEPDPECRLLVVRILGRFRRGEAEPRTVETVSRFIAMALEDPHARVRIVAAEELGHIGAKAGVVYLLPQVGALRLDPLPEDEAARADLVREYNACRLALRELCGRNDVPLGAPNWVPAEGLAANRAEWTSWLDGPEGVGVRLEALAEMRTHEGVDPSWLVRYLLVDVLRSEPAPAGLALATYRVLRDAVAGLGEKARASDFWAAFPVVADAEVDEAHLPDLRARVKSWWAAIERRATAKGD